MTTRKEIFSRLAWSAAGGILAAAVFLGAGGWPPRGGPGAAGEESHAGEEAHRDLAVFTPEEREEFGLVLGKAGPGTLRITRALPGEVVFNPETLVHVVPRAAGVALTVRKELGDPVREGEVLAVIESPELGKAKGEYLSKKRFRELARADLERARAVHRNTLKLLETLARFPSLEEMRKENPGEMGEFRNRLVSTFAEYVFAREALEMERKLFAGKVSSKADLLAAESRLKKAAAALDTARESAAFQVRRDLLSAERAFQVADFELKAAERRLHVLGLDQAEVDALEERDDRNLACWSLRAPSAGVITAKHLTRGEMVDPRDRVFTIADTGTVWVRLTVYQKDVGSVKVGRPVEILGDRVSAKASGRISYVTPFLDEETRTAAARVVLTNEKGLWKPGMFVTGRVVLEEARVPLAVPATALMEYEGRMVVFVETKGGMVPRPVKTGRADGRLVEVLEGLRAGETYVRKNAFVVKAELLKSSFGEGHSH